MATEGPLMRDGAQCTANADLSAKQYFCVKLAASRAVDVPSASTDLCYGILQNKPKLGDVADVAVAGVSKAVAGAAITAGAKVMMSTTGKVITFVGSAANCMVGEALEAAGADLDVITVKMGIHPVLT